MGDRSQTEYSILAPLHSLNLEVIAACLSDHQEWLPGQWCQPGAVVPAKGRKSTKVLSVSICPCACFPCIVSFLGTSAASPERMQAW